ncbi:MAG TPA: transcription elongation factor GreA [Candidatus Xenobia bacterium]|jgi:transcription elongation factor GreA
MSEKEFVLTRDGSKKLEAKLDHLRVKRRKEVAERIRQAKEFGEIGENSEYEDAKSEQAFVEGEIMNIENILRHAKIIDEDEVHTDMVSVGSVVELKDMQSGEKLEYKIVGTEEADPVQGFISDESPVGAALTGCKKNQTVEIKVPEGVVSYKILKILRAAR